MFVTKWKQVPVSAENVYILYNVVSSLFLEETRLFPFGFARVRAGACNQDV